MRALFTDIGGVLATNGWDTDTRHAAVAHFRLDAEDIDARHRLSFELFETGKQSWDDYLKMVVFHEPRSFSHEAFTAFVLEQSQVFPEMLALVAALKQKFGLKVVAVSNEGRELTEHRIQKLKLDGVIDFFVSSCFVHLRKPDPDIFKMALDLAQVRPEETVYLEDRQMFVEVAQGLGLRAIRHRSFEETRAALAALGLDAPLASGRR